MFSICNRTTGNSAPITSLLAVQPWRLMRHFALVLWFHTQLTGVAPTVDAMYIYIYIMIGSTLGVLESDENGKECQLPMSNLFPHNQLIPLRDAALPFSQILQEVPRFEVSAMPGFRKGKGLPGVPKWPSEDSLILL